MAKTPFIRPLQVQGGTFYAFSSAAEDLSFTFNNSINKFKFSKFALLNIPEINSGDPLGNSLKLNAPDSAFIDKATNAGQIITTNQNVNFSQSFQSYCLNLETTILSGSDYDSTLKQNISERVFWKWLKELGGIRYQPASSSQVVSTLDQNTVITVNGLPVTQKRYVEGDPTGGTGSYGLTGATYNRVVQYIGNLDIVNSVKNNNNTYSEVYVLVPTRDGNTPTVLFKNVVDPNYPVDFSWTNNPADPLNDEYLTGRAYDELNPSGLTNLAIFDCDVLGQPQVTYTDTSTGTTGSGNWYSPRAIADTYFTDSSFTDPTAQILEKSYAGATSGNGYQKYVRTILDSVGIDFDPNSYKQIVDDPAISTFEEFNATSLSSDFSFNAVLIYYDVYDPAVPADSATNLYGVLFLDDVQDTGVGTYEIPGFKKFKPNPVTKLNGNSYGLKLNIKFDVDIDQTGVEQAINDYSPFSLTMFMDAVNVLQDASATLNNTAAVYTQLEDRVSSLENLVLSSETTFNIDRRINAIESTLAANQALFNNTQSIMGLINQNYELIRAVINNETSVEISYNLNLIKQGQGILVDRSIPNQLTISNDNQDFDIGPANGTVTLQNVSPNNIILRPFGNYIKHVNNGVPINLTSDLVIRIDDYTLTNWKRGQLMRFSFGDQIIPGNFNVTFLTNAVGKYPISNPTNVPYSTIIISMTNSDFVGYDYKPVIDIVCIDPLNLIFQVDQVGKSLTNNS
jgi:hypothetical protein